jgi:hypothetical protein
VGSASFDSRLRTQRRGSCRSPLSCVALAAVVACSRPDPTPTPVDSGAPSLDGGFCAHGPPEADDVARCPPATDDYQPRTQQSADDAWPACISDDGVYHPLNPGISSVARVAAFDDIARRLWDDERIPSAQDFLEARVVYAQDQGLDSRVQRREDVHYDAPPQPCSTAGIPDAYPDRCAGPATLLPILNDAFARGGRGETPVAQAARIEAGLTWFLYLSTLSEGNSCATKPQDCDSAWAYYSGGTPREAPAGLARRIRARSEEAHQRAYDGTLALRCWRNLDHETTAATDLALRDRALAQLDRALLRGIALVVRQRFLELDCTWGEVREARWSFLQVLVPLLERASRSRDPVHAEALLAQVRGTSADSVNSTTAAAALDALFPCP